MDEGVALADREVVDRPHVGAVQVEDQEHLRGPAADAAHGRKARDDLLVVELRDPLEGHSAVRGLEGEVAQRGGLARREATAAQRGLLRLEYGGGRRSTIEERREAGVDRERGLARQLLEHDRAREGVE